MLSLVSGIESMFALFAIAGILYVALAIVVTFSYIAIRNHMDTPTRSRSNTVTVQNARRQLLGVYAVDKNYQWKV